MIMFIVKSLVRFLGIAGLAVILPAAASNPLVVNDWLIYLLGAIVALNILFNEPKLPTAYSTEPK